MRIVDADRSAHDAAGIRRSSDEALADAKRTPICAGVALRSWTAMIGMATVLRPLPAWEMVEPAQNLRKCRGLDVCSRVGSARRPDTWEASSFLRSASIGRTALVGVSKVQF